ncbi:UNVERIFIED_CONTAM: Intraflagellar transport protein 88 [Siphonaria sp. JEL0065]|nr:Intraflagellar transport protein 88 [Siphonaria sp. JEL0065]
MAEQVRFHLEKMIPELEDLEQRGVFNKTEIKEIVKRRTAHEYAVHRRIGRRADYLKYIEYEINLDRLRKKRKIRLGLDVAQDEKEMTDAKKKLGFTLSDYSLTKRINALYQKALKKFSGDVEIAIQLHPTNPSMYILAAQYEFINNKNMTSARVLMQRGLRINKEATNLWHEYFKLELLWTEKIKERRRILFGDSALGLEPLGPVAKEDQPPKRKLGDGDDDEDEANDDGETGVQLQAEDGDVPKTQLDIDPTIQVSNDASAQDPALTMGKKLSAVQQAMIELAIPKAIYRNAIKEIPNDLEFRIGFLRLYQTFGTSTKFAQDEVYESLKTDFAWNPVAVGVLAEKPLVGLVVSDTSFPSSLKSVVESYEACVKATPTPQMWTRYTTFLTETLSKVTETNLQRYLFVVLQKSYTRAHEGSHCAPEMYISWAELSNNEIKAKYSVLEKGVLRHPASGVLWTAKLRLLIADVETQVLKKTKEQVEAAFAKALSVVGKPAEEGAVATLDLKTERFGLWKLYLEWVENTTTNSSADLIDVVEKRFRECLGVQELGSANVDLAEFEAYIIVIYLDWSFKIGGIDRVRTASDRLISFKQRSTFFFNSCLEFEERDVLGGESGGIVEYAKKSNKASVATPVQIARLRKMHELVCFSDASRIDSWIAYLSFEMYVTKDFKRVNEVHWRANKEVADKDEFALRQAPPTSSGRKPNPVPSSSTQEDDLYSFEKKVGSCQIAINKNIPYKFNQKQAPGDTGGYRTSGGRVIGTSAGFGGAPRTGAAFGYTSAGRTAMGTSMGGGADGPRPMTSVRAAGYSSRGRATNTGGQSFDPFNQATAAAEKALEPLPEEQIKTLEKKINLLIEESTIAASQGNNQLALEKAKDAGKRERALAKQRDQAGLGDQINLDLTYCVLFNLANQYHGCKMYQEALNSYAVIVKNKMFNQSGRLRVNMGNIYFEQQKYSQAVKMYRMALDQIPNTNRDIRLKIMRNIGAAFVKMGQFQDAITSFESIMEISPDHHTGFNLILCYFALGDRERMKKGLQKLVSIKLPVYENDEIGSVGAGVINGEGNQEPIDDHEVFNEDKLRAIARERSKAAERFMILAAKLVAPSIESNFSAGFDMIIEIIKSSPHAEIASELEIAKAIQFLKSKDFSKAIETLKSFEKKDPKLVGTASTNLSFLYFLESDFRHAEKYAQVAIATDRYNAKAQTNLGNCFFQRAEYDKAKEYYQEAVSVDALCTEAMYNLG